MLSTLTKFPMPITTPRLILRPPALTESDIQGYYDAVTESMPELKPWLPWAKYYPSISQVEEYIEQCKRSWKTKNNNNIGLPLWIFKKDDNTMIGSIVMWNIVWKIPKVEFGYWLRTSQTGNGYISEATNALTQYCFEKMGVKRIEIKCEAKNTKAKHVPERLGYNLDGVLLNSVNAVADGKLTDSVLYSCINTKNLPKLKTNWGNENF